MNYFKISTTDCHGNPSAVYVKSNLDFCFGKQRCLKLLHYMLYCQITGNRVSDVIPINWSQYIRARLYYGAQTPDNWYGETTTMNLER